MIKPFTYLLLFVPFITFAQTNYKNGFIVKNDGTAVQGFIDYREWSITPKNIAFKNSINEKPLSFDAKTIQSFQIENSETYISYRGRISMDRNEFPELPTDLDTTTKQDTIFLRQLANGPNVTLLGNKDFLKSRFFVMEQNKLPEELIYHQYYTNASVINNTNIYKNQLNKLGYRYLSGNNKLQPQAFNEVDLRKAVNLINGQMNKKTGSNVRFFAGIALNQTTTKFEGTGSPWVGAETKANYLPKISIGADVFDNPNVQKIVFRGELSFNAIAPKFNRPVVFAGVNTVQTYSFNQYNLTFTPQVIYNLYNSQQLKFFVGVGAGFNLSAYSKDKVVTNPDPVFAYSKTTYDYSSFWLGFPVQAGVALNKHIEIIAVYTHPSAYTQYSYFSVSSTVYSLGLHFLLNKK